MKKKLRTYRKRHAKKRILERHGISLTDSEYEILVDDIIKGESLFCMRQSHTRSLHQVLVHDQQIFCIYNSKTSCIVTFLHNGWVDYSEEHGYFLVKRGPRSKDYRAKDRSLTWVKKKYGEVHD